LRPDVSRVVDACRTTNGWILDLLQGSELHRAPVARGRSAPSIRDIL